MLFDLLGYDAVAVGAKDFAYGAGRLVEAAALSEAYGGPAVLSANVLDAQGRMVFDGYEVFDVGGFAVGVIGRTAPAEAAGYSFLDEAVVANAQAMVDAVAAESDYVVVLGSLGTVMGYDVEYLAENVKGIDLIVEGSSYDAPAGGKRVGDTLIVSVDAGLQSVGVVQVHVVDGEAEASYAARIEASDVKNPAASDLAKMFGVTYVPADEEVQSYIDYKKIELDKVLKAEKAAAEKAAAERAVKLAAEKAAAEKAAADAAAAKKAAEAAKPVVKPVEFDVYLAHTGDIRGQIEEGNGIGFAKLATGVKFGRAVGGKTLLLDAGNATSGSDLAEMFAGVPVCVLFDLLGFDAVAGGA